MRLLPNKHYPTLSTIILACTLFSFSISRGQDTNNNITEQVSIVDTDPNSVSEQIKTERDIELHKLQNSLVANQNKILELNKELSLIKGRNFEKRIELQDKIQNELDNRIQILEQTPKVKVKLNGQLAFTELIKIQKDINPAQLYLSSNGFYAKLGSFDNLQNYTEFKSWKKEYNKWYRKNSRKNMALSFIHKSINIVSDASNKVPLYGAISQSVTSGITMILSQLGNRNRALLKSTPKVLVLLNSIGQFSSEKAVIDNQWHSIDLELQQLQKEYELLLDKQIQFYGIEKYQYQNFLNATLDKDIDAFKNYSRTKILEKINTLDGGKNNKWMGTVETYMYQVQSIRTRFGELTARMLANLDKYEELFSKYNDVTKFSKEFVTKSKELQQELSRVRDNFVTQFNPVKYIEDSAVMYIER